MDTVLNVLQNEDESSANYQACTGIFFNTEGKLYKESNEHLHNEETNNTSSTIKEEKGHVMISYNWDVQKSMIEVISIPDCN